MPRPGKHPDHAEFEASPTPIVRALRDSAWDVKRDHCYAVSDVGCTCCEPAGDWQVSVEGTYLRLSALLFTPINPATRYLMGVATPEDMRRLMATDCEEK